MQVASKADTTPKYDREDRLANFPCRMMDVVDALPNRRAGNYIAGPLVSSCHSPTFNYGEAQAAESRAGFIQKLRICLKESKECRTALKISSKKQLIQPYKRLQDIFQEREERIAIFAKSIETAKNKKAQKRKLSIEN